MIRTSHATLAHRRIRSDAGHRMPRLQVPVCIGLSILLSTRRLDCVKEGANRGGPRKGLAPDGFVFKLQVFRSSLDFDGSGSGSGAEGLVEAHSWVSWGTPKNASNPCDSPPLACCLLAAVAAMAVAATVATKTKPKPNSRSPAYSRLDSAILQ